MGQLEILRSRPPRSWLFVPALRARDWMGKAIASGADALILDLEDATAPTQKAPARDLISQLQLREAASPWVFVRVNPAPAEVLRADVEAAVESGAAGVVLPKVARPEDVTGLDAVLDASESRQSRRREPLAVLVILETARGILNALPVADASSRVIGIAFGAEDLSVDLRVTRTRDPNEFTTARELVVLAAASAGIAAVDTPWLQVDDKAGAKREAIRVKQLGFAGKLVIHPAHVGEVNEAFSPTEAEVEHARAILQRFAVAESSGEGVVLFEGRMIDRPLVDAARHVLVRSGLRRSGP